MRSQKILSLFILGLATLLAGCQSVKEWSFTGRLWDNPALIDHYEPAPHADVKLFLQRETQAVLVQYDEEREKTGKTRRRAYFLLANERQVERENKPCFVPVARACGMEPIPTEPHGATNVTAAVWAEFWPDAHGFKLMRDGAVEGEYRLPVYVDKSSEAKRVLLTPAAVTIDAVAAGTIVGLYAAYCYAGWYAR